MKNKGQQINYLGGETDFNIKFNIDSDSESTHANVKNITVVSNRSKNLTQPIKYARADADKGSMHLPEMKNEEVRIRKELALKNESSGQSYQFKRQLSPTSYNL